MVHVCIEKTSNPTQSSLVRESNLTCQIYYFIAPICPKKWHKNQNKPFTFLLLTKEKTWFILLSLQFLWCFLLMKYLKSCRTISDFCNPSKDVFKMNLWDQTKNKEKYNNIIRQKNNMLSMGKISINPSSSFWHLYIDNNLPNMPQEMIVAFL